MSSNLETLVQLFFGLHEEFAALAWIAIGILLPVSILMGLFVLRWVLRGGLRSERFFTERCEADQWLRNR